VDLKADRANRILHFGVKLASEAPDPVSLHLERLPCLMKEKGTSYYLEAGEKVVRLQDAPSSAPDCKVLDQFTTERLLLERARNHPAIEGLERLRDFSTYDLLYVGIAKAGDSFARLIGRGHKARMDILSNEPQRYPGARVTDEIYLFLFEVDPLVITTYELSHDFSDFDFGPRVDVKRVVADAEKAFVSLLKPEYNIVKFHSYPRGADGLYGSDLERYGYVIGETLAFNTAHGRIKGCHEPYGGVSNAADCILVEGDNVSLLVSGVDFPSA
jgi:hypothetical protein